MGGGVSVMNGFVCFAEHRSIVRGTRVHVAPMRFDVRFIPDLVIADGITVARCYGGGKPRVFNHTCRWGKGVFRGQFMSRPGGRAVQHNNKLE